MSKEKLKDAFNESMEIIIEYENRIEKAIDKIQTIRDLGFDYDGFNKADDLKGLIDTLVEIAGQSIYILKGEYNDNRKNR